ncbi:MAG: hypothetical protein EA390_11630 [Balneolaceae bacterium]|nr:MAG: hypothetical protein EA390_11630 [Balneolaceae bacterium]
MKNSLQKPDLNQNPSLHARCLYCGQPAGLVWVHGHGQCAACGTNVDECCRGESCELEPPGRARI